MLLLSTICKYSHTQFDFPQNLFCLGCQRIPVSPVILFLVVIAFVQHVIIQQLLYRSAYLVLSQIVVRRFSQIVYAAIHPIVTVMIMDLILFVFLHPVSNVEEYHCSCNAIHLGNFRVKSVHHLSTSFPCDMYSEKSPSIYRHWERQKYKVRKKVFKISFEFHLPL